MFRDDLFVVVVVSVCCPIAPLFLDRLPCYSPPPLVITHPSCLCCSSSSWTICQCESANLKYSICYCSRIIVVQIASWVGLPASEQHRVSACTYLRMQQGPFSAWRRRMLVGNLDLCEIPYRSIIYFRLSWFCTHLIVYVHFFFMATNLFSSSLLNCKIIKC